MKTKFLMNSVFTSIMLLFATAAFSQTSNKKVNTEINSALLTWNHAAKEADLKGFMNLFDDSENSMLVGSDSGEIFKGKAQISQWLSMLFKHNRFEWEMNTIHIDSYKNTAWVFVDGFMIVTNDKGKANKTPYRFSGVLVKQKHEWKWRIFDGSIPRGE